MTDDRESDLIGLMTPLNGPLLIDVDIAKTFASLILRRLCGEAEAAKQEPLDAIEWGSDWVIMGSFQESDGLPGAGAWYMRTRKTDCRVGEYGLYMPQEHSTEVLAMIAEARRANAAKGLPEPDRSSTIELDRALAALVARRPH